MNATTIYEVTTEGDCEGRTSRTVGYATGNVEDIKAFYDRAKMYELRVTPVKLVHVTPDLVYEKRSLLEEKRSLEKRLKELEEQLR